MRCKRTVGVLTIIVVLGSLALTIGGGPVAATTASCTDDSDGALYTAPSNLTVQEASTATMATFPADDAVRIENLTISADGEAFVRVEQARDGACLSDVNATSTPVTIESDDATVTIDGHAEILEFKHPATDETALAYRAPETVAVTLADAGFDPGTTVAAATAGGELLAEAIVAENGSLTLALPARTDTMQVQVSEKVTETTTPNGTDSNPENEAEPETDTGTDAADDPSSGFGVVVALVGLVGIAALRRL